MNDYEEHTVYMTFLQYLTPNINRLNLKQNVFHAEPQDRTIFP